MWWNTLVLNLITNTSQKVKVLAMESNPGSRSDCCSSRKTGKSQKRMLDANKHDIKVVILGDAYVGKSSIAHSYCNKQFNQTYDLTIGGVYNLKQVSLSSGKQISIHLWDTGGEERFRSMTQFYYKDAQAALLVYDVHEQKSFANMVYWLKELECKVANEGLIICIAGNKCDGDESLRQVSYEQGLQFCKNNDDIIFQETSAKTNEGINELFLRLLDKIEKNI